MWFVQCSLVYRILSPFLFAVLLSVEKALYLLSVDDVALYLLSVDMDVGVALYVLSVDVNVALCLRSVDVDMARFS